MGKAFKILKLNANEFFLSQKCLKNIFGVSSFRLHDEKKNLSFVYIFYCPISVFSVLSSPPSSLPIVTKSVSIFS